MVNPPVQASASLGCELQAGGGVGMGGCPQLFLHLLWASPPPPYLPPASWLSTVASCRKWCLRRDGRYSGWKAKV